MSQGISVALIPAISGREYVLVANNVKAFQKALSDYETHICLDDLDKLFETNLEISLLLKAMQKQLTPDDRLYQMLKTYRSRCRTVQQLYRKWRKGEALESQVSHAAYLVLRGIPFYPETHPGGWILKSDYQEKRKAS